MRIPRKVALWGATALLLVLLPAASASAYSASEKRAEKRQNARTAKLSKDVTAIKKSLVTLAADAPGLTTKVDGIDGRLKAIEAAAPALIKGLSDLKTGLETAGGKLAQLGDAYQSVEYGVARLYNGSTEVTGATLVSSDIPDDGNSATASGTLPFVAAGGEVLTVRGAIRSAESDGAADGPPAGQAGGILYAVCATPPTSGGNCGAVSAGQIGCQTGPPPPSVFQTPAGDQSLTLVPIQQKAERTDQTAPSSSGTNVTGGSCTLPTAGVWNVFVTTQFVDLPTSATPGPKE